MPREDTRATSTDPPRHIGESPLVFRVKNLFPLCAAVPRWRSLLHYAQSEVDFANRSAQFVLSRLADLEVLRALDQTQSFPELAIGFSAGASPVFAASKL